MDVLGKQLKRRTRQRLPGCAGFPLGEFCCGDDNRVEWPFAAGDRREQY